MTKIDKFECSEPYIKSHVHITTDDLESMGKILTCLYHSLGINSFQISFPEGYSGNLSCSISFDEYQDSQDSNEILKNNGLI